ncbi:unnamed protein product [Hyaloperonospora brassicae]|uniref:FYVE-type domain-containing protein n=1 Tax=Hyaloperonospora brassicae TaxID=162125 RepID=A0AAV0TWL0_HYABA|nr:unnamed protein product [Hyaloperonospora brassicae]
MNDQRFTHSPFDEILLSADDRANLVTIADALVRANVREYRHHVQRGKHVDLTRWKRVCSAGTTATYLERSASPSKHHQPRTKSLPASLMVGPLPGTLEENMFGLVSPTLDDMRLKASYLHDVSAAAVLATIVAPSVENPFRSVVVKWMEIDIPGASLGLVRNRDYVYLESCGIAELDTGERLGYHLLHSVSFPQAHELPSRVRGNMSFCGVFCQEGPDRTDCRGTGIMDPGGDGARVMAIMAMVQATMAGLKYSYCGRMKKLVQVLSQRPEERVKERRALVAQPVCVTCSKPIKTGKLKLSVGKSSGTCKLCDGLLCSTCKIAKKLSFLRPAEQPHLVQRKVTFCVQCLVEATSGDTLEAARQQFVDKNQRGQRSASDCPRACDLSSRSDGTMSSSSNSQGS